jgi:vesicle-fusing ATPase
VSKRTARAGYARASRHTPSAPSPRSPRLSLRPHALVAKGRVAVGMMHRLAGALNVEKPHRVEPFFPPAGAPFVLASIALEVSLVKAADVSLDAGELAQTFQSVFANHVYKVGQTIAARYRDGAPDCVEVKLLVKSMEFLDVGGGGAPTAFGQVLKTTTAQISKSAAATTLKLTGSSSGRAGKLIDKGFNFEELGIGGLDEQFKEIFRRAFASRLVPPEILKRMGQNHVRGMLLYGPPGCGKTLIARKIGRALHAKPPKIVNGPEIMNKYVGASEENIRNLFKDAEAEQAEKGDDSELHIIILDEMDAICRVRGSTGGGTGVGDSMVNQFLSKIDGVDSLNNILLIGMTNRMDMIDEAMLRPGRLELHIEIGLPNETGRLQILNIHTSELRKSNMLDASVDLARVSELTKNYTGAEIEGLVKSACSYIFTRATDIKDPTKPPDFTGLTVNMDDFLQALTETKPQFGVREGELEQCATGGIIPHGDDFAAVSAKLTRLCAQLLSSERTPLLSVLLTGAAGSGKSALAVSIARASGIPYIRRISGDSLLGMGDKATAVTKIFADAYRSPVSLVILDDIERIIEFVRVGPRFNNDTLQTLLVVAKALPPPGHRMLIIGTTAVPEMLEDLEVTPGFQLVLRAPVLSEASQFAAVLAHAEPGMARDELKTVAAHLAGKEIGIKKLLSVIEMARQDQADSGVAGPLAADAIMRSLVEWGL